MEHGRNTDKKKVNHKIHEGTQRKTIRQQVPPWQNNKKDSLFARRAIFVVLFFSSVCLSVHFDPRLVYKN